MITDSHVISAVSQHHLLAGLTDGQLQKLWANANKLKIRQGETLFNQGDHAEHFYFVLKGSIRLYRISPSGHEKVVDIVRERKCFAEALMFSSQLCYPVTANALVVCELLAIRNATYRDLLRDNIDACFALMSAMSERLHQQLNEIENLSLQNALHRLVNYLMQTLEGDSEALVLDVPKRHLASMLAIQPETLSRLLRKLCQAKILSVEQNRIMLLDKRGLYKLAEDSNPLRSVS